MYIWMYSASFIDPDGEISKYITQLEALSFDDAEEKAGEFKKRMAEAGYGFVKDSGYLARGRVIEEKKNEKLKEILDQLGKIEQIVGDDDEIVSITGTFNVTLRTKNGEKWDFKTNFGPTLG